MGLLDKIENFLGAKRKEANILVVGLDSSGKSTIINHLKPKESKSVNVAPTVGFNTDKFSSHSLNYIANDMSGQSRYRSLWEHYYREADAIVYVIDSSDRMRFVVSKEELHNMLNHNELKNRTLPVLVLANKIDVKGSISTNEIGKEIQLDRFRDKTYSIFGTNALTGDGINEAFEWLTQELKK